MYVHTYVVALTSTSVNWLMSARFLPLPLRRGPSELLSGLPAQGTTRVVVATWQLYCSSIVDCLMYNIGCIVLAFRKL